MFVSESWYICMMYWDTFTDIWILLHTCCTTLSFVGYHGVKTYRGRWAMRETHRRSICKPKNCDFSYWHKDSPVVISSFAVFRPLWWCPNRDPFLRRRACQPPNFSRAIEECKIGLPVIKCKIHFNILMPRFPMPICSLRFENVFLGYYKRLYFVCKTSMLT